MRNQSAVIGAVLDCLTARGAQCEVIPFTSDNLIDATSASIARFMAERSALAETGFTPLLIRPDALLASDLIAADLPRLDRPLDQDMQRVSIISQDSAKQIADAIREAAIIDGNRLITTLFDDVKDRIAALRLHWSHLPSADPNGIFLDFYADRPLILARFPTANAWSIPAYISTGREDIRSPAWICAVFQHWAERYGAAPFAMSSSGWHLTVDRPPFDVQEAVQLMIEQIAFCPSLLEFAESPDFRNGWALGAQRWGFWRPTVNGALPQIPRRRSVVQAMARLENLEGRRL